MKKAVSNIAWSASSDELAYELMQEYGFVGLEIAPTRIFPIMPYDRLEEARLWASDLKTRYGFSVPSMQSIWYGRQENLFGSDEERQALMQYSKQAVDFAGAIGCKNLVFGCPRNRNVPEGADADSSISFFSELGNYALERGTIIGIEANPTIYGTNFINDTLSAIEFINNVNSKGFKLNLDIGTMIQNNESVSVIDNHMHLINHVHISEPMLKPICSRQIHSEICDLLKSADYMGFVSIEMGKQENVKDLENVMNYVCTVLD